MQALTHNIAGVNPDLYHIEYKIRADRIGSHWLTFTAIRTGAGWQLQDATGSQFCGETFGTIFDAAAHIGRMINGEADE